MLAALIGTIPISITAQEIVSYETDQSFDDVVFGLESAILDRGLVIDGQNHVGEMLARTNLVGPASFVKERIAAYQEAGVTHLQVTPVGDPTRTVEQLRELIG